MKMYYSTSSDYCELPNVMSLEKANEDIVQDISVPTQIGRRWVGLFETYFHIDSAGTYTFKVSHPKQSSSSLWVDGHRIAECQCCEGRAGSRQLGTGNHHVMLLFTGDGQNDRIDVSYEGADTSSAMIRLPQKKFKPGVVCCYRNSNHGKMFGTTTVTTTAKPSGYLELPAPAPLPSAADAPAPFSFPYLLQQHESQVGPHSQQEYEHRSQGRRKKERQDLYPFDDVVN